MPVPCDCVGISQCDDDLAFSQSRGIAEADRNQIGRLDGKDGQITARIGRFDGRLIDTPVGRGDVTGSSFEFFVAEDGDRWVEENGTVTRTVKKGGATLRQVGPVSRPAYGDAPQVALRCEQKVAELTAPPVDTGKAERERQLREAEMALAKSGLSV